MIDLISISVWTSYLSVPISESIPRLYCLVRTLPPRVLDLFRNVGSGETSCFASPCYSNLVFGIFSSKISSATYICALRSSFCFWQRRIMVFKRNIRIIPMMIPEKNTDVQPHSLVPSSAVSEC